MDDWLVFCVTVIVILFTPGPTNTLLATSGATVGFRRSLHLLVGELVGYNTAIVTLRVVFAPIVQNFAVVPLALRFAASTYLIVLAVRLWRARPATQGNASISLREVFVTTLLNPKAILLGLIVVPQESRAATPFLAVLSLLIVTIGTAWIAIGCATAPAIEKRVGVPVSRGAAVLLLAFAGVLLTQAFV
jgi:threonine/homoserine/homoserine lactone efflux protein